MEYNELINGFAEKFAIAGRHCANTSDDGNCAIRLAERYGSVVHLDGEGTVFGQCR